MAANRDSRAAEMAAQATDDSPRNWWNQLEGRTIRGETWNADGSKAELLVEVDEAHQGTTKGGAAHVRYELWTVRAEGGAPWRNVAMQEDIDRYLN